MINDRKDNDTLLFERNKKAKDIFLQRENNKRFVIEKNKSFEEDYGDLKQVKMDDDDSYNNWNEKNKSELSEKNNKNSFEYNNISNQQEEKNEKEEKEKKKKKETFPWKSTIMGFAIGTIMGEKIVDWNSPIIMKLIKTINSDEFIRSIIIAIYNFYLTLTNGKEATRELVINWFHFIIKKFCSFLQENSFILICFIIIGIISLVILGSFIRKRFKLKKQ